MAKGMQPLVAFVPLSERQVLSANFASGSLETYVLDQGAMSQVNTSGGRRFINRPKTYNHVRVTLNAKRGAD